MKKTILIFYLLLNFCWGYSQLNPADDMKHTEPQKGLVKKETILDEDSVGKDPYLFEVTYYNNLGYETSSFKFNNKGDTLKQTLTYYLGNGLELILFVEKGQQDSVFEQYNERNFLVNDLWLMGPEEPSDRDSTYYYYDANGNLTKMDEKYWKNTEVYTYKNNKIISVLTTDADVDIEDGEKPEVYISTTYKYLDGGKKIEMMDYIGKDAPFSKTIVTLNNKNSPSLRERYVYKEGKFIFDSKREYIYYVNGIIKSEISSHYQNDILQYTYILNYNEKGLLEETVYDYPKISKKITHRMKYYYN